MKMKRKLFIPLIAALLTVCLTSVGFAAWVIVGGDTATANKRNFTAYKITDERYQFDIAFTDDKVVWGHPATIANDGWLVFRDKSSDTVQDLSIALTLTPDTTLTNYYGKTVEYTITTSVDTTGSNNAAWKAAAEANYVALPSEKTITIGYDNDGNVSTVNGSAAGQDNGVYTLTLDFAWGTAFGGNNPYTHYNGIASPVSSTYNEAKTALGAIFALNGSAVEYVVTVVGEISE